MESDIGVSDKPLIETLVEQARMETKESSGSHRSLAYPWFVLIVITWTQIANTWCRNAVNSMYGFGVKGKDGTPFYSI